MKNPPKTDPVTHDAVTALSGCRQRLHDELLEASTAPKVQADYLLRLIGLGVAHLLAQDELQVVPAGRRSDPAQMSLFPDKV